MFRNQGNQGKKKSQEPNWPKSPVYRPVMVFNPFGLEKCLTGELIHGPSGGGVRMLPLVTAFGRSLSVVFQEIILITLRTDCWNRHQFVKLYEYPFELISRKKFLSDFSAFLFFKQILIQKYRKLFCYTFVFSWYDDDHNFLFSQKKRK